MNIDEMQAGCEMDCIIAEKIFGWEDASWDREAHCHTGHPNKEHYRYEQVPEYSTDIAAAWEVEEEIKNKGIRMQADYITELTLTVGPGKFEMVHATPEQRCKAALKAVLYSEPPDKQP